VWKIRGKGQGKC